MTDPARRPDMALLFRRPCFAACLASLASLALLTPPPLSADEVVNTGVTTAPPAVVGWIRAQAQPLTTVEAGHGFADLEPLRALIGDARVVALGEPTHGSREVFQLKHRLVEYLAAELGFNVFAIEANMPEARQVDDYVSRGAGDPAALIRGMKFWTWYTEEVRALVEGLRVFNLDPANQRAGRHVAFTGFDLQFPSYAATLVRDYVAAQDASFLPTVDRAIAALHSTAPDSFGFTPPRPLDLWRGIEKRLENSVSNDPASVDLVAARWSAQCARLVVQSLSMETTPAISRDESMARNVEWLLAQNPGTKIVLWAHNEHVKRTPDAMGGYLAQRLGRDLIVIGFATGRGTYRARARRAPDHNLGTFPLEPPPGDSCESAFTATGLPLFLLDLHAAHQAPTAGWLLAHRPFRTIGAMELTDQFQPALLARNFDAVAWIAETSAAVPLPGGWPPLKR